MNFGSPPEDLDYSIPMEPMRLRSMRGQQDVLKDFLSELVDTHPTKLTKPQRDDVRSVYRQVLLNVIYNSVTRIYSAVPRGTQSFKDGTYWSKLGLTFRHTVAVLDRLAEDDYILQMKGVYNGPAGFSRLTRVFGTDKLAQRIDIEKLISDVEFFWDDDAVPVVLTGFDYSADRLEADHPDVERIRAINKFLKNHHWQQRGPVRIVYKNSPMHGGRVYTRFQNMPKQHRWKMKIDGKETVELDFKANHLSMLIAMQGVPLPKDPYLSIAGATGLSRDQVKNFVTSSLGASGETSAFNSLKKYRFNKELFCQVRDALLELFPGVPLFRGFGTVLQSLEGQIALDIMYQGALDHVVVLPVHDSFVTTQENKQWLWQQMLKQWAHHVKEGAVPTIDEK